MDRSKRTSRTPKRFDDGSFITPPRAKEHHQPKPAATEIKPLAGNIIKVKLTKKAPKPSVSVEPIASPKQPEPVKAQPDIKPKLPEPKLQQPSVKAKQPETKVQPIVKPKQPEPKVQPIVKPKQPEIKLQPVVRPKTKRPRTPPIYADLIPNVILPFWDARTAAEDHEDDNVKELVHCHCGIAEESGLMVQCETCLTWQHAHCLGFEQPEDAPDGYTCKACSDPKFARTSMKWAYDQEWLTKGRMKQFACDKNPLPERNVDALKRINNLIGDVLKINQILHSLRIKYRILREANDDDPDLNLFRVLWPPSYQHRDGSTFIPTFDMPSSTPASTISVVADTPGDISVCDGPLPDIGHLEDVLDAQPPMATGSDATPKDCRANLKLHIHQTEEFIGMELANIEEQLVALEKECAEIKGHKNLNVSLDSLKADLRTMKSYLQLETSLKQPQT